MKSANIGRAQVTKTDEGVYIVIPSAKNWPILCFLGFWLCGWLLGEIGVLIALAGMVINGSLSFLTLFLVVWLCGWTLGGYVAGREFIWGLMGSEQIIATPRFLSIKRSYRLWSSEDNYDAQDVERLRIVSDEERQAAIADEKSPADLETIKFDMGGETRSFGIGLDDAQSLELVNGIKEYIAGD